MRSNFKLLNAQSCQNPYNSSSGNQLNQLGDVDIKIANEQKYLDKQTGKQERNDSAELSQKIRRLSYPILRCDYFNRRKVLVLRACQKSCSLQVWPLYIIEHRSIDFFSTASGQMNILFLGYFHFTQCPLCNGATVTEQAIECCTGFVWQGSGSREAAGLQKKFPPYLTEPAPGSSKMDPQLPKDEVIRDGGITSGIMYLSGGKNPT